MGWRCRSVAEFDTEILTLRLELANDGGGGAKADIQILERVVIDEVELNIFVATTFGRLGIDRVGGSDGGLWGGLGWFDWRGLGSARQND